MVGYAILTSYGSNMARQLMNVWNCNGFERASAIQVMNVRKRTVWKCNGVEKTSARQVMNVRKRSVWSCNGFERTSSIQVLNVRKRIVWNCQMYSKSVRKVHGACLTSGLSLESSNALLDRRHHHRYYDAVD